MQKLAVVNDIRGATTLSVLGAVLVPISLAFVLFSTPTSRRQPIFWIQSLALLLAMTQAAVEVASYHIDIATDGNHPALFYNLCAARESLKWVIPWITDCALLFKILCFYPRTICKRGKQAAIIAFPSLIKVPRLVVIIINLVIMCRAFAAHRTTWAAGLKFQVAEIAMQVADNSYCSSILLFKSWQFYRTSSTGLVSRTVRAQRRARHIVESVAMSFVPALCIQIAFLVVQAIPGDNATKLVEAQNYLFIVNVYVSLIFSILATSWSSICNIHEWNRTLSPSSASIKKLLPLSLSSTRATASGKMSSDTSHKRSGTSSNSSGEKDAPEHRTLLQYLTSNDVDESKAPSDGGSECASSTCSLRRPQLPPLHIEKSTMSSDEDLESLSDILGIPKRKPVPGN